MEKDLVPSPSPWNCSKYHWKLLPLRISINWPSLVTSWLVVQKIYSKMYLVSRTNNHRDVTDSVKHGMVKNTETWISWERNIIFLRNKEIFNLCLRWHILRNYHFVAEVTFKITSFFILCYYTINTIKFNKKIHTIIMAPKGTCFKICEKMSFRTTLKPYSSMGTGLYHWKSFRIQTSILEILKKLNSVKKYVGDWA